MKLNHSGLKLNHFVVNLNHIGVNLVNFGVNLANYAAYLINYGSFLVKNDSFGLPNDLFLVKNGAGFGKGALLPVGAGAGCLGGGDYSRRDWAEKNGFGGLTYCVKSRILDLFAALVGG